MKKTNFLASLLSMIMLSTFSWSLSACSSDEDAPSPVLSVNNTLVHVEANGLTNDDIIVTAENTDWSVDVKVGREWLTAYKNGRKVSISAKENTNVDNREGVIIVSSTEDSKLSHQVNVIQRGAAPYITVNGANDAEHTFPGLFDANKSGIDYKQSFKIKSNVQWNLSGKVDWLNISPTTGNGDVDLAIYPTSANNSDNERNAVITLSGEGNVVTINITQQAGKPVCYVKPANEIALWDRICWEYTATPNINVFQWILLAEEEYKRMTEMELLEEISQEEPLKYVDEYLSSVSYDSHYNKITENTTYYLITIAYDENGVAGELQKTKIRTPKFLNVDDDAWVDFENIKTDLATCFLFDAIKEGYCNTYHLIYGICDEIYNKAIYAFEINYYLKHKKKHWLAEAWDMEIVTDYPNNHTFTYYSDYMPYGPICLAYGWGVFKDGTLSSDILGFSWDTSEEFDSAKHKTRSQKEKNPKNITLARSVETEKAMKLRK